MISKKYRTNEHVVSRTYGANEYADLAQHDNFVQLTKIIIEEVLLYTSIPFMLDNTSV